MAKKNAVYAQSGGVTPVINASAYGVLVAAQHSDAIAMVFAGYDGINGVLEEKLIDLSQEAPEALAALRHTPAGAFGSARRKLQDVEKDKAAFQRILDVFAAHDVQYFFYNGGNDSMDTVTKLSQFAKAQSFPLQVIGIPKTIDNDLPITDCCPGFGSVAKYNAVSMMEGALDTESMHRDSTKVFVLETMGRHAGWIAAATGLAHRTERDGPHLILLPEVKFDQARFLEALENNVRKLGYCAVTVSEGVQDHEGKFLSEAGGQDAFGHTQLGGAGNYIQELIKRETKLKVHGAVLDYCQRSARHVASTVDVIQAIECGKRAVELATRGGTGRMVTIVREQDSPYTWSLSHTDAANIANKEKMLPEDYIREDGFHVTEGFRNYCLPLIQGEDYPPYEQGLPAYARLKKALAPQKLAPYKK
ncbi:MAG: 6-phosphofructokinase [Candidatus Lambdaproteobacteria bacterium]|nr:6-phosphofructokinase [Candidatus Lambdaproteobacteria bacterium]